MPDYVNAFNVGVAAAMKADRDRKEINEIFCTFADEISRASDEKIQLKIKAFKEKPDWSFTISWPPKPPTVYHAIVVCNPSSSSAGESQVATWALSRHGYPCTVTWSGQEHACHDKGALENCLSELAGDPIVGQAFVKYMNAPPDNAEEAQQDSTSDSE